MVPTEMSPVTGPVIEDWGQMISFSPAIVLKPTSIDEVKEVLASAHADGRRVRVPGSLHSCSEIVVSDALLDISGLPKEIVLDDDLAGVEATANVSLHEFLAELGVHGKSVTATGGTDHQTLAGLISTGTAPASSRHALYEKLEWVELVTIDGVSGAAVERRIAAGDADWPAVICSLGVLGVLTRVRFAIVDELYFDVVQKKVRLADVLSDLDATSATYDFWRVNWVPKSDNALLWAATAVPRAASRDDGDYPDDHAEQILDVVCGVVDKLAGIGPLLGGALELVYDTMALTYGTGRFSGPLRNMLPVDRRAPLHVAMAEWSFRPRDVGRVVGACEAYFDAHGWPNIPTEIELTRVDGSLMSAWSWDDEAYIVKFNFMYLTEVCTKPGEKQAIGAHLHGLWDHFIAQDIEFKAHWGKLNFIDPAFAATHHAIDAFRPLVCPVLMNDYLEARIGPVA
jgi:FAD/FMN-containing dehydrogenase